MTKEQLTQELQANHEAFIDTLLRFSDEAFMFSPENKWTAGQHIAHLCKSIQPLVKALRLPATDLIARFGASEHISKSYSEVVATYQAALQAGGVASEAFIPQAISVADKDGLITNLRQEVASLVEIITQYSEEDLDKVTIPHPLLGKMTLREMIYFTMYHAMHHQKGIEKLLA